MKNLEQIDVRLDDKLSRIMSGQGDEDEDVEQDIIGYLILKRVAKIANGKRSEPGVAVTGNVSAPMQENWG